MKGSKSEWSKSGSAPRVLIANRGEIAVRVARTVRACGMTPVGLRTPEDAGADAGLPDAPAESVVVPSYVDGAAVVAAAARARCDLVHPGYGFLSESAAFARLVEARGLTWVGPSPAAMALLADKRAALRSVAGLAPVLPSCADAPADAARPAAERDARLVAAVAQRVPFPVIVKPAAGGGGKGMAVARSAGELRRALGAARRAAVGAFGDASGSVLVEHYVEHARHVEVQVFADAHGHVVHLGDRDCSVQRRRQKVLEEAPAPALPPAVRARLHETAVRVARAARYVGAGTVEFLVDARDPARFWFLEMNARLQVEHPVTEAVTGTDLVQWQLDVARGRPLPVTDQAALAAPRGAAVEARLCAEDPARAFAPAPGRIAWLRLPRATRDVRVDTGVARGSAVSVLYDPLLAKIVARGRDRAEAHRRLAAALAECQVAGVATNAALLRRLVADPRSPLVRGGVATTTFLESPAGRLLATADVQTSGNNNKGDKNSNNNNNEKKEEEEEDDGDVVLVAALAAAETLARTPAAGGGAGAGTPNWRLGGEEVPCPLAFRVPGGGVREATYTWRADRPGALTVALRGARRGAVPVEVRARADDPALFSLCVDGLLLRDVRVVRSAPRHADVFTPRAHYRAEIVSQEALAAARAAAAGGAGRQGSGGAADTAVDAPLTARVAKVHVRPQERVVAGQTLATLEAMKMEHTVTAPRAGVVVRITCTPGTLVKQADPLFVIH